MKKMKKLSFKTKGNIFIALMLTIPVLNFLVFFVYVNFKSVLFAFQLPDGSFTLENFKWFFENFNSKDSVIIEAIKNTLVFFSVNMFITLPLSLLIGYFLYKKIKGHKYFRLFFFLPSIVSAIVLTTIFKTSIGPDGPLMFILSKFNITEMPEFLANSDYALKTIVVYSIWTGFGTNVILLGGAFSRIPYEVIESGKIDGVGPLRELVQIMIPMIWPTVSTIMIFSFVGIFSASGPILLFTKGNYRTMTISYWIFEQVNDFRSFGIPSAAGLIFTIIGLPIVLTAKKVIEKFGGSVEY